MNKKLSKWLSKLWPFFILACFALILTWVKIAHHAVGTQYDTIFHVNRLYDARMQLKLGNWSPFMSLYSFNRSGRIVNGLYGPLLAYFFGALFWLVHSWFRFQVVTTLGFYFLAGLGFYLLAQKTTKRLPMAGLLPALVYMTFTRTVPWETGAAMQVITSVMAPYVLLICWQMLTQDKFSWLGLALVMAITAQSHLMDCFIFLPALLVCAVIGLVHSEHKQAFLLKIGQAILLCLVLTANVWLPLCHFVVGQHVSSPAPMDLHKMALGLSNLQEYSSWELTWTLLIVSALNLAYVLTHFKQSSVNDVFALLGSFYLWVSSRLFPWRLAQKCWPSLMTNFQFPNRLQPMAIALLLASCMMTADRLLAAKKTKQLALGTMILLLGSGLARSASTNGMIAAQQLTDPQVINVGRAGDAMPIVNKLGYMGPDYLPNYRKLSPVKVRRLYQKDVFYRPGFGKGVLPGARIQISWLASRKGTVTLPIVMYKESRLSRPVLYKNAIGAPTVRQHKGLNHAILSFATPKSLLIAIYVTLAAWLILLCYGLFAAGHWLFKREKNNE
jgi:hypothetical protein